MGRFVDGETYICAAFLNVVDDLVFDVLRAAKTPEEVRVAIDVLAKAPIDGSGYAQKDGAWAKISDLDEIIKFSYYLGPHGVAPSYGHGGVPLAEGMIYYNTVADRLYVWNGLYWQNIEHLVPAGSSAYELLVPGQVIDFSVPDENGNTVQLLEGSDVFVYGDGKRILSASYTVDVQANTLTFASAPGYQYAIFDILVPRKDLAPQLVLKWLIGDLDKDWSSGGVPGMIDGIRTDFEVYTEDGQTKLSFNAETELEIMVDGIPQEPKIDYTVNVDILSFTVAPKADSNVWGYWYDDTGANL